MATIQDIAYVLVYKDEDDEHERKAHDKWRDFFVEEMRKVKLEVEEVNNPNDEKEHMILISAQFNTLAAQAEKMRLEMPLDYALDAKKDEESKIGCCSNIGKGLSRMRESLYKIFDADKNTEDFIAREFVQEDFEIYRGSKDDPKRFFREALKSLFVYNILIDIDISNEEIKELGLENEDGCCVMPCMGSEDANSQNPDEGGKKRGLLYLRYHGIYTADFPLHDPSILDRHSHSCCCGGTAPVEDPESPAQSLIDLTDERKELYDSWTRCQAWFKFQPMWRIRDYFGEKVAFYFAWCGHLIASLWIPALIGLAIFFYGLQISIKNIGSSSTSSNSANTTNNSFLEDALAVIRDSFDNDATPIFAILICMWGTLFTETWRRRSARLAYYWDVDEFEENEPDRPEYDHRGTIARRLPGSDEMRRIVPGCVRFRRYMISFAVLLIMITAVCLSVAGVIVFRIASTAVWFTTDDTKFYRFLTASIVAPVMNAVSMILLQILYNFLAGVLTNWENHRTQTEYNDSLILKMFCFQFINSYASLFYIAFFQNIDYENGMFGLGPAYRDSCGPDGKCMSQLSFQLLVMMIVKPFPKFCSDVLLPIGFKLLRRCFKRNSTGPMGKKEDPRIDFITAERNKAELNDFTLMEYSEKVIQFGYVMLFAASFPLAPLIALITDMCDIRVDSGRLLRLYRRPVPFIAQDIGMWEKIVGFLSLVAVISNAFLIAFTSQWGQSKGIEGQLWIIIGFEHICMIVKYVTEFVIPDIPTELKDTMADEKHWVDKRVSDFRDTQTGIKNSSVKLEGQHPSEEKPEIKMEKKKKSKRDESLTLLPPSYHETDENDTKREQSAGQEDTFRRDDDYDGVPRQRPSPRKKDKKKKKKKQHDRPEETNLPPQRLPPLPFDKQLLQTQSSSD